MLTVVLFGIGTDYILFLLFRYRERLRAGDAPRAAIIAAVERVGEAIFSAAFAVIAAFGALVLAALGFFTTLGPALAIGVLVMLAGRADTGPGVVICLLGRRVFWPSHVRRAGFRRTASPGSAGWWPAGRRSFWSPAWSSCGGLAGGVLRFHPDYDPIGQLPAGTEAARAFDQT